MHADEALRRIAELIWRDPPSEPEAIFYGVAELAGCVAARKWKAEKARADQLAKTLKEMEGVGRLRS